MTPLFALELYSVAVRELDVPANEWSVTFKYIFEPTGKRIGRRAECTFSRPSSYPHVGLRASPRSFVKKQLISPRFTGRALTLSGREKRGRTTPIRTYFTFFGR